MTILIWFFLRDVEVFRVGVRHADFLFRPVVAQRFQVAVIVVPALYFKVDYRAFLLSPTIYLKGMLLEKSKRKCMMWSSTN